MHVRDPIHPAAATGVPLILQYDVGVEVTLGLRLAEDNVIQRDLLRTMENSLLFADTTVEQLLHIQPAEPIL